MTIDFRHAKYRRSAGPFSLAKYSTAGIFDDEPDFDAPGCDFLIQDLDRLTVANLDFGDRTSTPAACAQGNAYLLAASWDLLHAALLAETQLTNLCTSDAQVQTALLALQRAISKANGHSGPTSH